MQGMETFLLNLAVNPEFAQAMLIKIASYCKAHMENFLCELEDHADIITIGDDLGIQENLLMSPEMYRTILKPIHVDFIDFIKKRSNAKILFHSDGDVVDLIEDFIEMGVDILNPIQTSAGRMANLRKLKKEYGKELVFCGAIDTQWVLPYGTPEDVRQEVRRVIDILGPGGGFLAASVHTIMTEVPVDNILSMVDALDEYGQYPSKKKKP